MSEDNPTLEQFKSQEDPVILDFWASWCMPCRFMDPAIKRLERQYEGKVKVQRINVDEQPERAREMGVYGIPTLVLYSQGQEQSRLIGAQPSRKLEELFAAASGEQVQVQKGLRPSVRLLRAGAGLAAVIFSFFYSPGWPLLLMGGVLMFSAIYDRCPVWQAVRARLKQVLNPAD